MDLLSFGGLFKLKCAGQAQNIKIFILLHILAMRYIVCYIFGHLRPISPNFDKNRSGKYGFSQFWRLFS